MERIDQMKADELVQFLSLDRLEKAMRLLEKVQKDVMNVVDNEDKEALGIHIGTVLALAFVEKIYKEKKLPTNFDENDWKQIAMAVSKYGIELTGGSYSEFVFLCYAHYILFTAESIRAKGKVNPKKIDKVETLAKKLQMDSKTFEEGKIDEVDYTENCLWTCLEAAIKILSLYFDLSDNEKINDLKDAMVAYGYAYAMFSVYKNEQIFLDELEQQRQQSQQMNEEKYQEFVKEIEQETDQFNDLLKNAFADDFSERLHGSANLARKAGVSEDVIIDSIDDIDDFFS